MRGDGSFASFRLTLRRDISSVDLPNLLIRITVYLLIRSHFYLFSPEHLRRSFKKGGSTNINIGTGEHRF